jgi:hypothetical protein
MAIEGFITIQSIHGPEMLMDTVECGAVSLDLSLPPTHVLTFGNAKAGASLMQNVEAIGIDMPLAALPGRTIPARLSFSTMILPVGLTPWPRRNHRGRNRGARTRR